MNVIAMIRGLRSLLPGRRWFALATAVALAAGVATPLLAQQATGTIYYIDNYVGGVAIDSSDQVWVQSYYTQGLRKLNPATNELTTYATAVLHSNAPPFVDGQNKVWLLGTIQPMSGSVSVLSRFDPLSLELISWPAGGILGGVFQGGNMTGVAVDSLGNAWASSQGQGFVVRVEPATDTLTTWTLPVTAGLVGGVDSTGHAWFNYSSGTERGIASLDPATNQLATWALATDPDTTHEPFVDASDKVWFVRVHDSGEDSIVQLDPATDTVTEWPCRPGCDGLVDVTVDAAGLVWFTEDVGPDDGSSRIGRLDPDILSPSFIEWTFPCSDIITSCASTTFYRPQPRSIVVDSAGSAWVRFANPSAGFHLRIARLTP